MDFYYDAVDKDVLIVSADGGLLWDNADEFVAELERYVELGISKLIVDCSRMTRISSYGLGTLVSVHKRLSKRGGDVKLASVSGVAGKVIRMTGLGARLHIYPTVEDARVAFGGDAEPGATGVVDSRHPHLD